MLRRPVICLFTLAGLLMAAAGLAQSQVDEGQKVDPAPSANEVQKVRMDIQFSGARHHRVRKLKKTVAATGVACAVIVAISFLLLSIGVDDPNQQLAKSSHNSGSEQDIVELRHVSMEFISDQQLLDMLDDIGHPSILAKIDGKAMAIPSSQRMKRIRANHKLFHEDRIH